MEARKPFDQAVDTREADPRLKRAKLQSGRLRSLAAQAACGVLVAIAALLALPQQTQAQTVVDRDWPLIPTGLSAGDQFRLIFLSSTKRNGSTTDIGTYNTFIQDLAAAGHTNIRAYSGGFRVVGCTASVDAIDNTATTGTGVPIYWLGGNQVANNYPDFYDGSWDDEVNNKNELGTNGLDTSDNDNLPLTGCEHDGTESFTSGDSRALGSVDGNVRVGRPNVFGQGPIRSSRIVGLSNLQPMYGLSQVFEVAVTDSGKPATPAAPSIGATEGSNRSLDVGWLEPAHAGPSVKYYLRYREVTYEPWSNGPQDVTITFANITGLRAGASYEVQVLANNENGDSEWSPSGTGQTDSGIRPDVPTNLNASANGQNRIDLNWTSPFYHGNSSVRSYKIEVRSDASNWLTLVPTTGNTDTEYSHTNLPANTTRHYRVSAINTQGSGPPSEHYPDTLGASATTASAGGGAQPQPQQSQTPLAASFVSVPPTHDGETPFWLELSFDTPVVQGSKAPLRELLAVTGGSETRLRRKDGQLDHWQIRIDPSSQNAVTVTLSPPPCGETGAVCTEDGRTFTTGLATQIHGPASGNNNWSDDSAGTAVTPVPALPLVGVGLLGLLLAVLGSRACSALVR